MFIGRYYHRLEGKGRLSFPKAFRDYHEQWVVTRGIEQGLLVFGASQFQAQLEKLQARTLTNKDHRDFIRLLSNAAHQVEVDKLGRINLPEHLITFAKLTKEVVVVGSYDFVEIWDQTQYHQYEESIAGHAQQLAATLDQRTTTI
jgi:MraZ protein